jgi:hypothetical protein
MSVNYSRFSAAMIGCATAALLFAMAIPAEAVTCNSVCNQVRRACNHAAKGSYKAGKIQCDEERDTCKTECVANAATCPGDCVAAQTVCATACAGDATCLAGCDEAELQCQDDCINCENNCDAARGQCRVDNKAARDALRSVCDGSRTTCNDVCVDPIDAGCVKACKVDERSCRADAKRTEGQCKKSCTKDQPRKSCMRSCRKTNSLDEQLCGDSSVLCYAGCAGVDLTPPATLP